jgi:hypothetical protein
MANTQPKKSFCEHGVSACVFCGKDVRFGHQHDDDEMILVHDTPECTWFAFCDGPEQFAMFTFLKMKSDAGQLERN